MLGRWLSQDYRRAECGGGGDKNRRFIDARSGNGINPRSGRRSPNVSAEGTRTRTPGDAVRGATACHRAEGNGDRSSGLVRW